MPFRAHKGYYGVDRVQEHSREEVIRDIRPVSSRFFGALLGQGGYAAAFCAAMGLMAFEPATAFPVLPLLALLCLCRRVAVSRDILPMRVPQSWKGKDYGDMTPQGSFRRARGMFYIGNDLEANRELWISRDDILTHMLILGTTGSARRRRSCPWPSIIWPWAADCSTSTPRPRRSSPSSSTPCAA